LLNENQCYLLENREFHTLTNKKSRPLDEIEDLFEINEKESFNRLINYIKLKKEENSFSNIDKLLLTYLNKDLKLKIMQEIDITYLNLH